MTASVVTTSVTNMPVTAALAMPVTRDRVKHWSNTGQVLIQILVKNVSPPTSPQVRTTWLIVTCLFAADGFFVNAHMVKMGCN
jgi:hypothetical protein